MPSSQSVSRLVRLSEIIARNSKLLNSHLIEKKLPQPSFSADAPPDGIYIGRDEPRREELERARRELVSATNELYDLSVGPRESVRNLAWDVSVNLLEESSPVHAAYSMKKDKGMLLCHECLQQKQPDHGRRRHPHIHRRAIVMASEPTVNSHRDLQTSLPNNTSHDKLHSKKMKPSPSQSIVASNLKITNPLSPNTSERVTRL